MAVNHLFLWRQTVANQGHSIPADVELDEAKPPAELWHGTGEKYVASIDAPYYNKEIWTDKGDRY